MHNTIEGVTVTPEAKTEDATQLSNRKSSTGGGSGTPVVDKVGTNLAVVSDSPKTKSLHRKRGSIPVENNSSAVFFLFLMLAMTGNSNLREYAEAKSADEPSKLLCGSFLPRALLKMCPWLLDVVLSSRTGSLNVMHFGLSGYYVTWASSRFLYFYRRDESAQEPASESRGSLRAVYRACYKRFRNRVTGAIPISEDEVEAFMASVSNQVAFRPPAHEKASKPANEEVSND